MNRQIANQTQQKSQTATPVSSGVLQRKCACGNHTIAGGECAECDKKKGLSLQTKLKVNEPGDIYEQEADRIAGQVMATPVHSAVSGVPSRAQRFAGQPTGQADAAPASVDRVLASPGRPMEPALRQDKEQRFGYDFSRVRVHTGAAAEQSARELTASPHAVGQNGKLPPSAQRSPFDSSQVSNTVPPNQRTLPIRSAPAASQVSPTPISEAADGNEAHEIEADRTADVAVSRLGYSQPRARRATQAPASGMAGLGVGRPMSADLRRSFEGAFDWDFSGVRLHTGRAAADVAARLGARAFTHGRDVVFGGKVCVPEASDHRRLLAHELTHVIQQDMGAGVPASPAFSSLSPASPARAQAAPLVTNVVTSAAELGVGGNDITATATVAGARTRLTWTLNPGGAAPAGVTVVGTGRRVRIHAAQPGGGAVVGGVPIVIRAEVTGTAGDNFDAPPVGLVQVVSTTYTANPLLAAVPSLIPGAPPANSAEPNRDGIAGNTAAVNAVTAPAGRPITVAFRRSLGATVAGNIITPGRRTGDIGLRITDTATRARLDEAQPAVAGPAALMALMADLTVNAVPTRVSALGRTGALGPYGQLDPITFASSDALHAPLTRIVGELITGVRDDFNIRPPNGAFNPTFLLALAVPADQWNDQLITPAGVLNVADGRVSIDVNRFVGPGVPHLPRRLIYRQRFQYASWQGAGAVVSNTIADGQHIRSLIGAPGAFQFRTEHRFGGVAAPSPPEAYVGNPLIILTGVTAAPTAPGATGLAADGVATANLAVNSTVAGRTVNWTVRSGDPVITAGNPAVLPATATLRAGLRVGRFGLRVADTIFPNRRVDGRVRVVPVRLRNLLAAPSRVPAGTLTSNVTVNAEPGGRTLNWMADAAATAAGVTVAPAVTGPGLAMNVTVTRPAGFTGRVTVTATDSVLAARTGTVRIQFL